MSDGHRGYSVLISLATKEEADVAASALRADGVDAFVGNEHHAAIEWGLVHAFGGVQVMVPAARREQAKRLLQARLAEAACWTDPEGDEPALRRDRYKAWLAGGWMAVGFVLFGDNVLERARLVETHEYWRGQPGVRPMIDEMCRRAGTFESMDTQWRDMDDWCAR